MSGVKRLRSMKASLNDTVEKKVVLPMDVTVSHKRAAVKIVAFGGAPYFMEKDADGGVSAYVPNGFAVEKFRDGELWIGETSVPEDASTSFYRFSLKRDRNITSSWRKTPTEAYKEANCKIATRDEKWGKGVNGRILIGVHYRAVQDVIMRFGLDKDDDQLVKKETSSSMVEPSDDSQRVETDFSYLNENMEDELDLENRNGCFSNVVVGGADFEDLFDNNDILFESSDLLNDLECLYDSPLSMDQLMDWCLTGDD